MTVIQRTFAGGELSPSVSARVDQAKYQTGLRQCRNMMIMRHGGATSRPGTEYIAATKNSITQDTRLIPFVFNSTQSYVLEVGHHYIRILQDGALVRVTGSVWSAVTAYVIGDVVAVGGVNYYCILAHTNHTPPNGTYWYAQTSTILEIPTAISSADLPDFKYAESNDVMSFVHPSYAPMELLRYSATRWVFQSITFAPAQATPTSATITGTGAGAVDYFYAITAVSDTGEESYAYTKSILSQTALGNSTPITITPGATTGAVSYNVYRLVGAAYEFLLNTPTGVVDYGSVPDATKRPPQTRNPFSGTGNYPACVAYSQQRLILASTNNAPQTVWTSRTGCYRNFTVSTLSQDDDAITFTVSGRQVNEIRNIIDLGALLLFTPSSEVAVTGDQNGNITPSAVNAKNQGNMGSSSLAPLMAGANAIYLQARGSAVRDLFFQFQVEGYRGDELTLFASHLVDGFEITDWAFQQIPHSIVWCVRDDGVLLAMTYQPQQQIIAWHRHEFDSSEAYGVVKNVCVIPEGNEDSLYLLIERIIDGTKVQYIERMVSRFLPDPPLVIDPYSSSGALPYPSDPLADFIGVDSSISYDGRNSGSTAMTISGGTLWDYTETLTLSSSVGYFQVGDVGWQIFLVDDVGNLIKFSIVAYSSTTVVTGTVDRDVPVYLRSHPTFSWSKAVDQMTGLTHLIGQQVSILADGYVVGSPHNAAYTTYTVSGGGTVNLDQCYAVIRVGLPITCDLETLDIDQAQGETIVDKSKIQTEITVTLEKSRGLWVGFKPPTDDDVDPLEGLSEMKVRQYEGYDEAVGVTTGVEEITISPSWNTNGRVFLRQVDPLPLSVLSIATDGLLPFRS